MTDHDARDPNLASRLRVEPLDEVTRARLIRTAVQAAADDTLQDQRARRTFAARVLAVAAAVAAVVVVSVVLLTRGSDEPRPAALAPSNSASEKATAESASPTSALRDSALASGTAGDAFANQPLTALGPLGEIAKPSVLRDAIAHAERAGTTTPPTCATTAATSAGTPVAAGTGTVDGEPATVIIVKRTDGGRRAVTVIDATCEQRPTVNL